MRFMYPKRFVHAKKNCVHYRAPVYFEVILCANCNDFFYNLL